MDGQLMGVICARKIPRYGVGTVESRWVEQG